MNHTLVIHIGMPKTGSTALQYFLYLNRDKLERHGWCYPLLAEELSDVNGASSGVTNGNCAPRRRAGSLAGEKPVCEGLTNQQ